MMDGGGGQFFLLNGREGVDETGKRRNEK